MSVRRFFDGAQTEIGSIPVQLADTGGNATARPGIIDVTATMNAVAASGTGTTSATATPAAIVTATTHPAVVASRSDDVAPATTATTAYVPTPGLPSLSVIHTSSYGWFGVNVATDVIVKPGGQYIYYFGNTANRRLTPTTAGDLSTVLETDGAGSGGGGVKCAISANGLKLYNLYFSGTYKIDEYTLPTAWDIDARTFVNSTDVGGPTELGGLAISSDGTKVFFQMDGVINRRTLATPYSIVSDGATDQTFTTPQTGAAKINFNADGTTLFVSGAGRIYQYSLSTPWSIASGVTLVDQGPWSTAAVGAGYDSTNNEFYILNDNTSPNHKQFAFIPTKVTVGETLTPPTITAPVAMDAVAASGGATNDTAAPDVIALATTHPAVTAVPSATATPAAQALTAMPLAGGSSLFPHPTNVTSSMFSSATRPTAVSADGLHVYTGNTLNGVINRYTLSVAWDLTTANPTLDQTMTAPHSGYNVKISPDGTRLYHLDGTVYQHNLATPWSITGEATEDGQFDPAEIATPANSLDFNSDGTVMYLNDGGNHIYQYALTTPWDVTTASYSGKTIDLSAQVGAVVYGFVVSPDERSFIITAYNVATYVYTFGTIGDITTLTFNGQAALGHNRTLVKAGGRLFASDGSVLREINGFDQLTIAHASGSISPASIIATTAHDAVTATGTAAATPQPASILATVLMDAVTPQAGQTASPAAIQCLVAMDAVTASAATNATPTPATILVSAFVEQTSTLVSSSRGPPSILAFTAHDAVGIRVDDTVGGGEITVVQSMNSGQAGANQFNMDLTAGNIVIAAFAHRVGIGTALVAPTALTNQGAWQTLVGSTRFDTAGVSDGAWGLYWAEILTTQTNAIGTSNGVAAAIELSGVASISAVIGSAGAEGAGAGAPSIATITTGHDKVIVGIGGGWDVTQPTGFVDLTASAVVSPSLDLIEWGGGTSTSYRAAAGIGIGADRSSQAWSLSGEVPATDFASSGWRMAAVGLTGGAEGALPIAAVVLMPATTASVSVAASPATIATATTHPAVTATGTSTATTQPATIITSTTHPAVTASAGATVAPATIPVTTTMDAAAASGVQTATATPVSIAVLAALDAVTPQVSKTATPASISTVVFIGTTALPQTGSPATIVATVTMPLVTASVSKTANPVAIVVPAAMGTTLAYNAETYAWPTPLSAVTDSFSANGRLVGSTTEVGGEVWSGADVWNNAGHMTTKNGATVGLHQLTGFDIGQPDANVSVDITLLNSTTSHSGVVARWNGTDTYYAAYVIDTAGGGPHVFTLSKFVAGVETVLTTYNKNTHPTGIGIWCHDDHISLIVDGIQADEVIDSSIRSGTWVGLYSHVVSGTDVTTRLDNFTATPYTSIVTTVTMPAPTITVSTTTNPAAIASPVAMDAATLHAGQTATPATIQAVVFIGTTALPQTGSPASIQAIVTMPFATASVSKTTNPVVIQTAVAMDAPTLHAGASSAPASIPAVVSMDAATVQAGQTATPATVPVIAAMDAASASGTSGASRTPGTISLVVFMDATTTVGVQTATCAPATISTAVFMDAVTCTVDSTRGPVAIQVATFMDAVTVLAESNATTTPTAVATFVAMDAVAASGTSTATASAASIPVITAMDQPTLLAGQTATPASIPVVATVNNPIASGATAGTRSPASIRAEASMDPSIPSGTSTATAQPASAFTRALMPASSPSAGQTATPNTITAAALMDAATLHTSHTVSGASVYGTFHFDGVTYTATSLVAPPSMYLTITGPAGSPSAGSTISLGDLLLTVTMEPVEVFGGVLPVPHDYMYTAGYPGPRRTTGYLEPANTTAGYKSHRGDTGYDPVQKTTSGYPRHRKSKGYRQL